MASALRFTILMIAITAFARVSTAANYTVTTGSGSGTGSLAWAINSANAAGAGPHTITVSPSVTTISISANLPIISTSVSIEGNGTRIVGNSRQLFVVNSGTVALRNMNVTGGRATGGTGGSGSGGGGGGLGAGGGLFVNAGAVVTVENVNFDANQARGGTGGATSSAEGGGGGGGFRGNGGAGGNGTNIGGGGGGGGLVGTGGTGSTGGGGGGGGGTSNGSNGSGANGGNGNGGGGKGGNISANGGAGSTPGGGGGGGQNATGGAGADFGGGGGGGGLKAGATGGFGAGGGGAGISSTGGAGGFGGGNGGDAGKSGGGGSGFGGAVFVRQGGSLTVINSSMTATNSVSAGTGSVTGQSAGSNLYVMSGVNATFGGTGTSQLAGSISGDGGLVKNDSGTLNLSGTNNYTGGTTVSGGKLQGTTSSLQGSITNNANVEFNQATSGTYAGTMSGTGSLTKAGTGTVTLSGPNTYSGGTTVSGGKLQGTTTSLQGNITNNANVEFNQSTTGTYAGTMSGTGSLTKAGTGTVTLSGPNSYSGGTTVSGGVLKGTTSSLQGNITNNATTEFDQTTNGTYAGTMSGSGALVKSGTGTVTLSGPNSYSGGTTVSGGTLKGTTTSLQGNITNNATTEFDQTTNGTYAGTMSGSGSLVKSGTGTVTLSGPNSYSGGTTVSGGTLKGTTSSLQGNVTNNATTEFDQTSNGTYAGTMSGSGALVKSGTGTVTLSGPNTYSGGTTVSGGKLQGTTSSLQGNITNNAAVEFNQSTNGTHSGAITGSGSLVKSGTGTVTLSGPNSYSGGTTVSGGVLKGTTSSLQGNITNNATTEFDQTTNGTYAGTMSGSGGLVKSGTGTVTLSGPNTYSGGTTVSGGTLKGTTTSLQGNITNNATTEFDQTTNGTYAGTMSGSGSLVKSGTGTVTLSGPNSYSGGTTVSGGKLQGTTSSLQGNITNNANVEFSQSTNGTYSGAMSGTGALVKSGTGTVTLSGPNSYSGGTTVSGGKLQGTTSSLQGNITNNAAVEFNQSTNGTHSGAITGSGSLVKSGTGTVTLSGPNSYSGGTTVSGGKLQGTTSSLQGNITNNANVEFSQSTNGTYSGAMSGTGALEKSGTGTVTLSGPNTYAGGTTVSGGTLKGTTSSLQGNITNNATTEFDQATNGTYAGTMSGSGSLVKSGTGTVTLSGPNTYSGGTTVSGGTLKGTTTSLQGNITNNATTEFDQNINGTYSGAMSGTGALVKNGTGTVTLSGPNSYSGGTTVSGGKLQGTTSGLQGNITNNAAVEFNQTTNGTHSGAISGSGSLVKSGTGTVTLSGPNSYSGGTTVSGGKLQGTTSSLQGNIINNATTEFNQATNGTYAGTVSGSGTLVKNGTGTVTLSGPNTYAGGTTVSGGTLKGTTTSLQGNITNNATTEFDQNTNGTYAGTMSGSGALVKSGTGTVTLSGPNSYSGGTTVSGGKLQGTTSSLQGNITNNAAVEFNQTTTGTHSGAITGSGSLVKSGTGTVTLSGPNSYSGGTTVSGGTLKGTTSSLQGNITNNAATEFDQNTSGTYAGTMSGSGSLAKSGSGTVTLNGPNFYSGGTTVNGGTLRGTTDSLQGNITNNATTEFDQSTNGTYAGTMSGSGALVKSGTGTVTLSGPNSYTGGTTVSGGTLRGTTTSLQGDVTNNATTEFDQNANGTYAGTMSGSGALVKNGTGTVTLSGPNSYSGGTTVSGGKLQGTTSSLQGDITNNAITEFDQNTSGAYGGNITGSGALVKNGTGTVTLVGPNSYSGGTTISGGTLRGTTSSLQGDITNNAITEFDQNTSGAYAGTMSGSGALVKNGTGTVTLTGPNSYSGGTTVSGGTLRGTTTSLQGNITNSATTEFDQNTDGTYAGTMSGAGALVKGGTGTVTLSGPNSYSGGTTVNGGTLRGTTDSLQGNITNNATTEFDQSTNGTYAGAMSGTGTLAKSGTGTVTLSGPNSYSGGTTVSGGTLRGTTSSLQGDITNNATTEFDQNTSGAYGGTITGSGALVKNGTGTVTLVGPNSYAGGTIVSGGTLRGTTSSLQGDITNNATTEFDQNTDGTFAGTMSGSGALVKNGGGTVMLSGPNSYSGGTTVNGGVLKGNTTSLQGHIINNATTEFDQTADGTYTGTMSGSGALVKSGTGTVTLTGPNSYSGGTTVSGGMLRGTTDSLQGNITNNAATEFDQNTDGAYAGAMSGSGALLKNGSGTVTLTGPNSYAGGTTVNQGTLRGTTSSLQGNITNNATTEFDQNTDGTYAGSMSGSGGLIKSGTGTVTLSGPNSFAGGTTVQGGTLRGTTDSLQGDITNNATTEFDQTTNGTYAGSMSGTGALVKSGTGTVTLSGSNSYSGGTTVNDGVLQGDATSLQDNIANNAHVTFDQTGDGIYGGAISGSGGVTKSGAGVLTMNGNSSYTGTTNIDAGGLIVNGNLTSDVTIASGATLDGSGNILGNVTNFGTVGTGNSIGTRTFGGTYTQQAGSILEVEINDGGTTPGVNSDLIQAQSVVLNGGTVSVLAEPGNYLGGSQYRFLSSTTAIVGQFDGIMIDPSAYALTLGYEYDAGLYWAYFTFDSEFSTFAQTANQLAIANYLDSISTGATGDLQVVLTGLDSLAGDPDAMRAAFDSMTDQAAPTMATVGLQNTTLVVQQLAGQLRSGSLGIGGDGTAFTEPAARAASGPVVLVSYNKGSAPVVSFVTDESCQRWNGWTMGYGLGGSAQSDGNAAGLTYGMGGTLLGLDRSLGDEGRLGFFGGYQGTGLQLTDLSQSGSINGGMLGSYIYQDDGFNYYSAISGLQFNGYETTRRIAFDGIDRTARGNFSGWQGYGYLERGVNLRGNRATLQPYAALQYIYLRQNSYTETGADTLNLANSGIDANSLRSLVGSRLQTSYTTRGGHLLYPELRALWLHEFLETDMVVNSFFAPIGGSSFATDGLNLGRDWAIVGGGLRYELPSGWQLVANYDVQANTQQVFHVGSGSLQYAW